MNPIKYDQAKELIKEGDILCFVVLVLLGF